MCSEHTTYNTEVLNYVIEKQPLLRSSVYYKIFHFFGHYLNHQIEKLGAVFSVVFFWVHINIHCKPLPQWELIVAMKAKMLFHANFIMCIYTAEVRQRN